MILLGGIKAFDAGDAMGQDDYLSIDQQRYRERR